MTGLSLIHIYMGYDSITVQKMYLAGALHDIGKMAVGNEILEKPDKLTDDEFSKKMCIRDSYMQCGIPVLRIECPEAANICRYTE